MDLLDNATGEAFAIMAQHPLAAGVTIAAGLLAIPYATWRILDPSRGDRITARHSAEITPRREPTMSRRANPDPGTYVSLTEPPRTADGVVAYDQIGPAGIRTAVDRFYSNVQRDPVLAPYFPTDDRMIELKRHLPLLLGQLLGGPARYEDPLDTLKKAHQPLGISPIAYAMLSAHLGAVLYELKVPANIRIFLMAQLIMVEDLIVDEAQQPA